MRMRSDLIKRMAVPTMEALAIGSVCYAGFGFCFSGAVLRDGITEPMFALWIVFAVGCVLALHDVRYLR